MPAIESQCVRVGDPRRIVCPSWCPCTAEMRRLKGELAKAVDSYMAERASWDGTPPDSEDASGAAPADGERA